jgi:hypothetical protein
MPAFGGTVRLYGTPRVTFPLAVKDIVITPSESTRRLYVELKTAAVEPNKSWCVDNIPGLDTLTVKPEKRI